MVGDGREGREVDTTWRRSVTRAWISSRIARVSVGDIERVFFNGAKFPAILGSLGCLPFIRWNDSIQPSFSRDTYGSHVPYLCCGLDCWIIQRITLSNSSDPESFFYMLYGRDHNHGNGIVNLNMNYPDALTLKSNLNHMRKKWFCIIACM